MFPFIEISKGCIDGMQSFFNKRSIFMDRFKKKILAFFSMFFVLFGLLTSCATNEDKFTLVVGMEAAYPPFNWTENQKTDEKDRKSVV